METCKIKALNNNNRMSTQELLQLINSEVEAGTVDFEIDACGQHDIGSALWANQKGKKLNFRVKNPGQRVGGMALDGTKIVVEGSSPADVGWLNSGAEITVLGDAGDTAAHCAAGGKIYIQGRVGTRSGALMKHDPKFEEPQFWVLKNTGSFSFEFMGGGIAVICGYECENLDSVLGNRSCVGMVGGTIYARGKIEGLSPCVKTVELDKDDKEFLKNGLKTFLKEVQKEEAYKELIDFSKWRKIIPADNKEKAKRIPVKDFKESQWFKGGLFSDMVEDNLETYYLAGSGASRLRIPVWEKEKCIGCNLCLNNCPQKAILAEDKNYSSEDDKCIGCGICEAVCPKNAWQMKKNA